MPAFVDPRAAVAVGAVLHDGVSIGPFAVIEDDVVIGPGCRIGAHAIIHAHVRLGARTRVEPFAVVGGPPQDVNSDPAIESFVAIGDDCVLREGVTIHRPKNPGATTRIGNRCYLMTNTHVAHDCELGDGVIFATGVAIGGHVQIGDGAFLGGGAMVHQFCRIGGLAMIAGMSTVVKDVMPYMLVGGVPPRHYRVNVVGLRRRGVDPQRLRELSHAVARMRDCGGQTQGYLSSLRDLAQTPEIVLLRDWLAAASRRGLYPFARVGSRRGETAAD